MARSTPSSHPAGVDISSQSSAAYSESIGKFPRLERFQKFVILRFFLGVVWCFLHLFVSVVHLWSRLIQLLQCYMISSGWLKEYRNIRADKIQYLAVVVDSEEAKNKAKVRQLLHWLSDIGVKYVILYDLEGVLKKSMETELKSLTNSSSTSCFEKMEVHLLSISDGKDGVAKAASFLCSKYSDHNTTEKVFTETDMENALKLVGCGGPEPDLLLIYGPVRCHLGFPAWRIRYTEIVYIRTVRATRETCCSKRAFDLHHLPQELILDIYLFFAPISRPYA